MTEGKMAAMASKSRPPPPPPSSRSGSATVLYYSTLYVSRLQSISCLIAVSYRFRSFTSRFLHGIFICTSFRCTWLLRTQGKLYFKNDDGNNFDSKQSKASGRMSGNQTHYKVSLTQWGEMVVELFNKKGRTLIRFILILFFYHPSLVNKAVHFPSFPTTCTKVIITKQRVYASAKENENRPG